MTGLPSPLPAASAPAGGLHGTGAPSGWVLRWAHLIGPGGSVLDVACGAGRHMQALAALGLQAQGVDRSPEAVAAASAFGPVLLADIESGPWPFEGRMFDAIVVTHYLWRPLVPALLASLAPGGVLLWETFARGHETVGRPSRPEFLLEAGELLRLCAGLRVVAFEDGFLDAPERFVQRIAAVRPAAEPGPARHRIGTGGAR